MTWLTAREIAGLPGMPSCAKRTREKLLRLSIPSRPRAGRVGGGVEFDCSALPEETRLAIATNAIQAAGTKALAVVDTPAARSFVPPAPTTSVRNSSARVPSQAEKDVADARVRLVNLVLELVPLHGLRRACQLLAARIITGEAGAEAQNIARQANQRARGGEVSARSLERWVGMHRSNGWFGLLPAAPQSELAPQVDDDVAAVLGLFHSKDHRFRKLSGAAKEVTRMLGRDFDEWRKLYHRARRVLDKLGQSAEASVALIKSRHTGAQRDTRLPFKRRDTSMLAFADVFVIDGHTFKAKVRHPDHGAPFAPELTVVLDAATRLIVGWSVNLSENVIAVGDALRHAVGQYGIPAILYGDNGAGETAKAMDCPIDGICARLGIDHRLGLPGKPQGHGIIERSWQTHAINAARKFGSFQGGDVDAGTFRKVAAVLAKEQRAIKRSEQTGEVIALTPKAPTWKQFVDGIEVMVHEYNTQHRHRGLPKRADGKHPTPMEAFEACFDPALQEKPSELELRTLFMPSVIRTAKRGQVQFFNQFYQAPDLMRRDIDGREVSVRYDIHNPNYVLIYTLGGEFVCEAQWDANRIDYFPKPVIQMAREKRVAQAVKRRELQIDTALRELGPAMDTTPLSLPEPSTPFVTVPSFVETPVSAINSPSTEAVAQAAAGRPFFNGPSERYEWLMRNQDQWTEADGKWLRNYTASESYSDLRDYYEGRGLGWNDAGNEPGLKSAL
ncbi:Mu transposase C-terminal domain-containing protein [Comamonas testosteroni]|uniref:Mu transposase C-terminal domain-containing protein n=1 Tax=Comamonas testosteroni TaxID=285 RepID=UPI0005B3B9C2|nr:Mu transposase C-terminal domain-containing protein [Comamonas testosteroni]